MKVAAAGVCHSDVRLADGELGDGRWPMVLGHEGAGVVESVGEGVDARRAGRPRRLLLRPRLPRVPRCLRRPAQPVRPGGRATASRGMLMDGTSRLHLPDGTTLQHGLMTACFAEYAVVAAAGAVPIPRRAAALAGGAARLRRRHRHRRGPQRRRACSPGESVGRDRLRRRRPAGDRAARGSRARRRSSRSTASPRSSSWRAARVRRTSSTRRPRSR